MTIVEYAKNRVEELKNTVLFYIKEGIDKEKALKMTLKETCLSSKYKKEIIDYVERI